MNIEAKVNDEINGLFEKMKGLDPTSEEYKAIEDAALKLIDRTTKFEELRNQSKELDDARKSRKWEYILRGAGIAIPPTIALIAAYGLSILERTESLTSTPAREFAKRALRLN